ncbi:MAG: T9SS type A sorting domain-containing protein [Saprospiraceae bacterium]|nr:T9SS type A sorting domain-containing protein [Saprospiraceae bacterium]
MKRITTLILTIFWITTYSQAQHPGPGTGMTVWLQAQSNEGQTTLMDVLNNKALASQPDTHTFNFNPAYSFKAEDGINLDITKSLGKGKSIFVVFKPAIGNEESIYSIDGTDRHQLMLTTHRMAELTRIQYMNFPSPAFPYPQLNTYMEGGISSSKKAKRFSLGAAPTFQNLPANGFTGSIAEVLIYDSMLSPEEKHEVESYLAIKYGLTLQHAIAPLVNLRGEHLWRKPIKPDFQFHHTVIGVDEEHSFFQPTSCSSLPGNHLKLSFHENNSENNGFISLRDNGLPFLFDENYNSLRIWSASNLNSTNNVIISWKEEEHLPSGDWKYWLRLDTSGAQTFHPNNIKYIAVNRKQGNLVSQPFLVDQDGSGDDIIQIVQRPGTFVDYHLTAGNCGSTPAMLDFKVVGNRGPYIVHVKNNSKTIYRENILHHDVITLGDLASGSLSIKLTDQVGNTTEEEIYVNDFEPNFQQPISMTTTSLPAFLDASVNVGNVKYTWYRDNTIISSQPQIRIDQEGTYRLTIKKEDCTYHQDFHFQGEEVFPGIAVELYPNPTINGYIYTSVNMADPAPIRINVHTLDGRLVSAQSYPAAYLTEHIAHVPGPGAYLVTFLTDHHSITRKLIAQ